MTNFKAIIINDGRTTPYVRLSMFKETNDSLNEMIKMANEIVANDDGYEPYFEIHCSNKDEEHNELCIVPEYYAALIFLENPNMFILSKYDNITSVNVPITKDYLIIKRFITTPKDEVIIDDCIRIIKDKTLNEDEIDHLIEYDEIENITFENNTIKFDYIVVFEDYASDYLSTDKDYIDTVKSEILKKYKDKSEREYILKSKNNKYTFIINFDLDLIGGMKDIMNNISECKREGNNVKFEISIILGVPKGAKMTQKENYSSNNMISLEFIQETESPIKDTCIIDLYNQIESKKSKIFDNVEDPDFKKLYPGLNWEKEVTNLDELKDKNPKYKYPELQYGNPETDMALDILNDKEI